MFLVEIQILEDGNVFDVCVDLSLSSPTQLQTDPQKVLLPKTHQISSSNGLRSRRTRSLAVNSEIAEVRTPTENLAALPLSPMTNLY